MSNSIFISKIDWWLALVLTLTAIVAVIATGGMLLVGQSTFASVVAFVLLVTAAVLPMWVMLSTHYTLTEAELLVVSGPFRWRVPLREITSVTPTRNPLSSPALSLDRLRIEYGPGKWLMVSPADKNAFLRALESRSKAGPRGT